GWYPPTSRLMCRSHLSCGAACRPIPSWTRPRPSPATSLSWARTGAAGSRMSSPAAWQRPCCDKPAVRSSPCGLERLIFLRNAPLTQESVMASATQLTVKKPPTTRMPLAASPQSIELPEGMRARITNKAFALWEERGCRDGHDLEDWLDAEAIVMEEIHEARE